MLLTVGLSVSAPRPYQSVADSGSELIPLLVPMLSKTSGNNLEDEKYSAGEDFEGDLAGIGGEAIGSAVANALCGIIEQLTELSRTDETLAVEDNQVLPTHLADSVDDTGTATGGYSSPFRWTSQRYSISMRRTGLT